MSSSLGQAYLQAKEEIKLPNLKIVIYLVYIVV